MEENRKITLMDALQMIINNLGNVNIPVSVLAIADPEQILAIKRQVIDPVELARRNLIEIAAAYEEGARLAQEAAAKAEQAEETPEEEHADDSETDAE